MMDRAIYTPLPQQPGAIRLLRLLPDPDENSLIRCFLFTYNLQDGSKKSHLYEALSYVWGDPNRVLTIHVSGYPVNVTENLHAALRRLRDHYFERVIWVDAICIDQQNPEEVKSQILFMARIYSQANRVLIWLGVAADGSDAVLEDIRAAGSGQQEMLDHDTEALRRLLERPWFRRAWVLQEAAAARQIRVLCGSMDLDGFAFCAGLQKLSTSDSLSSVHPVTHLIKRATFRSANITGNTGRASLGIYKLGQLLDLYHEYEASKRHDKIYALMGMSSDDLESAGFSPDYDAPWHDLLKQVISHILNAYVRIYTWPDREVAIVRGLGFIIGQIISIADGDPDMEGYHNITFQDAERTNHKLTTLISAKSVRESDIICQFRDAPSAMIVRPCQDHFAIVAIHVPLTLSSGDRKSTDLVVVWKWEKSASNDRVEYASIEEAIGDHNLDCKMIGFSTKYKRQWNVIKTMWLFKQYGKITQLPPAISKDVCRRDYFRLLDTCEMLMIAYFRTKQYNELGIFVQKIHDIIGKQETLEFLDRLSSIRPLGDSTIKRHNWELAIDILDQRHTGLTTEALQQILTSGEEVFRLFLCRAGESFRLTEEMLLSILSKFDPSERHQVTLKNLESLLAFLDKGNVEITERVLAQAIILNRGSLKVVEPDAERERTPEEHEWYSTVSVLMLLMEKTSDEITISARFFEEFFWPCDVFVPWMGDQLFSSLETMLGRLKKVQITERVLLLAVRQESYAVKLFWLLFTRDPDVQITETLFAAAANNRIPKQGYELLELLLEERPDVQITARLLEAIVCNDDPDVEILQLVSRKRPNIPVSEKTLIATGFDWRGPIVGIARDGSVVARKRGQIAKVLLEHDPDARITEEGLQEVAWHEDFEGDEIQFYLKHNLVEAEVGEKYLARARAVGCFRDNLPTLIRNRSL